MSGLRFRNVKKKYANEHRYSVDGFDADVGDGEFLVLVGPSGCGKSTLLRMIAGLEDVTEGEIHIGSRLVNYVPSAERNIAMVFQNYALYPQMTVYENIAFGLRMRKLPKHAIHEKVTNAAKILEISALLDKRPGMLSGGQRQRVALGRAIVREPEVFLMDEPLSNLDAKLRVTMREEIMRLHRRLRTTFVYVTHDQIEAMTMGTRIVVMRNGVIQQVGTPKEIYDRPVNKFVAEFIGSPPINAIKGKIVGRKDRVYFETRSASLRVPDAKASLLLAGGLEDREVILGVRAEAVRLAEDESVAAAEAIVAANVDFLEYMGADTYLHAKLSNQRIKLRVDGLRVSWTEGDKVSLAVRMDRALFFDPQSEELLA